MTAVISFIGDFRDEMKETIDLMMGRFAKQAEIAYKVIEKADNAYWRCDPKEPVFNKTYVEITRFLQVRNLFVITSVELNFYF